MRESDFPAHFFDRIDTNPDRDFYEQARLVVHIDAATIDALTDVYRESLDEGAVVLDLMSSWVSHLPDELRFDHVAGLGMNRAELDANERLDERVVHDLNRDPELPFPDAHFDAVLLAVSVQYLTQPVEVFRSVARVLRPGGCSIVALSHRCFPTKAIRAFHGLDGAGRSALVRRYHELADGFADIETIDRSPEGADPLWIVRAVRRSSP